MTIYDLFIWIYDKLIHNTTRWYTSDGKIRGAYINHIGMGLAEDFSTCTPEIRFTQSRGFFIIKSLYQNLYFVLIIS